MTIPYDSTKFIEQMINNELPEPYQTWANMQADQEEGEN